MSEKIPRSLAELAQNNSTILEKYNILRAKIVMSFEQTQQAGSKYLQSEFRSNAIDANPDGKMKRLGLLEVPKEKREMVASILEFDPAMIIVRPEMYHVTSKICDFLKLNGFTVDFISEKQISVKEYFQLYKEVIRNVQALATALPSRTLTYTNGVSSIIIFTDPTKRFQEKGQSLADGFFDEYKGREGRYTKNTIRGEVVYQEALKLGFDKMSNPVIAEGVDPFAAYSNIIKQPGDSWYHLKAEPDLYALMYNAQGIHLPNSQEIIQDMATVHSLETLVNILEVLVK